MYCLLKLIYVVHCHDISVLILLLSILSNRKRCVDGMEQKSFYIFYLFCAYNFKKMYFLYKLSCLL